MQLFGLVQLMGVGEIADLLGVSRQRVYQLSRRPDFPAPVASLRVGRVWDADEIREWAARREHPDEL